MKKLLFYAAALLAAISFSACSDDDEEPTLPATPGNIAGTWQSVSATGFEIYDGQKETWSENYPDENGCYYTYTFNKNGTYTATDHEYDEFEGAYIQHKTGSYSISGNTFIIVENYDNESHKYEYKIKKLTKSELVLQDTYEEPDYSFEETSTFKRIE